jgi:hypothetical protein
VKCIACWLILLVLATPMVWGWIVIRRLTRMPKPPPRPGQE